MSPEHKRKAVVSLSQFSYTKSHHLIQAGEEDKRQRAKVRFCGPRIPHCEIADIN